MSFSRTVETYVDIDAPPQQVWDVLADFAAWPDWNPFIPKVEGSLEVGQRLHVTVAPPGRKPSRFPPVFGSCAVGVVRPCEEIVWGGGFLGVVFRGDHALLLEPLPQGRTRFRQRERFRGVPVPFMSRMFEAIEQGYHQMNDALKRRVEPANPAAVTS